MSARFQVLAADPSTRARAGLLTTAHGSIRTPAFMPVGTQAALKGLTPDDARAVDAQCILANAYHLWVRPGAQLIRRAGGLHQFMGWPGPILTDSGGFQLLSLRTLVEISEDGASVQSPVDGTLARLTPEIAMEVQANLGSDIAMALDICPPFPCELAALRDATERTVRWAERSLQASHADGQAVFGIVQGGVDVDLRRRSAQLTGAMGFDGYGIGGLSVGESRADTWPALEAAVDVLPPESPRYLMGVGAPGDLLDGIARGVDFFDSVYPTRLGRRGSVFVADGRLELASASLARRAGPIDPRCDCPACTDFTVGYLHHLIRAGEELGMRLASLHNVRVLTRLAGSARDAILEGRFQAFTRSTAERGHGGPGSQS